MPIQNKEDIKTMIEYFNDQTPVFDKDAYDEGVTIKKELGDRGITRSGVHESPLMFFIEWLAGVENAHYLLFDEPKLVNELSYVNKPSRVILGTGGVVPPFANPDILREVFKGIKKIKM